MTEWYVQFIRKNGEEGLVVLPSFRKLLWWFLRTARDCNHIMIFSVTDSLGR